MTFEVLFSRKGEIEKMAAAFSRKAQKYGCDFSIEYSEPYTDTVTYTDEGRVVDSELVEVFDVTVSESCIGMNGWNVIAKIEHGDKANIVSFIGENKTSKDWRFAAPYCEHCGTNRRRNITFVVSKDGEERQVGNRCLKDYTGIDPALVMAFKEFEHSIEVMGIEEISDFEKISWTDRVYEVSEVLGAAIAVIREQGYVRSDERNSNKEAVGYALRNHEVTEADVEAGKKLAEDLKAAECGADDNLMSNIKALVENGYCKEHHFGFMAYAPKAYEKYVEKMERARKAAEDKANEAAKSRYVGEVGERVSVKVADAKMITSYETAYGYTHVYKFHDVDGNVLVWFSGACIEVDKLISIKGTVKAHNEYNGVCETVMTRCKVEYGKEPEKAPEPWNNSVEKALDTFFAYC